MLEAKEVNFAYLRGQPVLNDIDIKIESGEFVALLGHNGSGKTTLSRLFMALIHPRSGQVLVDGGVLTHGEGVPEGSPGHPWVHSPAHVLFPPRSETGVAFPGQGHPVLSLC